MSTPRPNDSVHRYSLTEWENIQSILKQYGHCLVARKMYSHPQQLQQNLLHWNIRPSQYIFGQSPRHKLHSVVYTATEYPPTETIPLHHELSYTAQAPRYLALYCQRPAETGGETPLLDGGEFLEIAPRKLLQPFLEHGLIYHKCMPEQAGLGKTWVDHFETTDRAQVEYVLQQNNAVSHWHADGALSIKIHRPAVHVHPSTNRPVWFAQPTLWHLSRLGVRGQFLRARLPSDRLPVHVTYGDGTEIPTDTLVQLQRHMQRQSQIVHWQAGDLLLLDNWWIAHGRTPFTGERSHWAAMGCPAVS